MSRPVNGDTATENHSANPLAIDSIRLVTGQISPKTSPFLPFPLAIFEASSHTPIPAANAHVKRLQTLTTASIAPKNYQSQRIDPSPPFETTSSVIVPSARRG